MCDLLLSAKFALLAHPVRQTLANGAVAVRNGAIVGAGTRAELLDIFRPRAEAHFPECALLPGLVNAHCHLEYTDAGPMDDPQDFVSWMRELLTWGRNRTPDEFGRSADNGARRLLRAGVTTVADVMSRGAGLRAMLQYRLRGVAFVEFVGGYADDCDQRLSMLTARLDAGSVSVSSAGPDSHITLGVSPHAPYTTSWSATRAGVRLARQRGLPIMTHLAESPAEIQFLADERGALADFMRGVHREPDHDWRAMHGRNPLEHALLGGLLECPADGRVLLAHLAQLSAADVAVLANSHVAAALCPGSNASLLAGGHQPVNALLASGIPIGIGTDSLASNTDLDMFAELRILDRLWREGGGPPSAHKRAQRLVRLITSEGATALGLGAVVGTIRSGSPADFAVVETGASDFRDVMVDVVGNATAANVVATFIAGEPVYHRTS